jgi:hypothetical protein
MYGCVSEYFLCLCYPVNVATLRRADPLSKEPYQLFVIFIKIKVKIPLLQAVEATRVTRGRGSHIT